MGRRLWSDANREGVVTQVRFPERLAVRCQLGVVMWNFIGYAHVKDQVEKALAAIPMREVEIDGVKFLQIVESDMEARS